ncbi:CBL-interacting serine/threonine-protein kinase 24 [Linum perenne]
MLNVTRKVGKYEVGRTIGEGTFAKVKFARNMETGENVAMKVLVKSTILKHRMVDQIKREISIMKIVRHPNIVRLHEVHQGRLKEHEARRYFQQLIDAVDHCHCKGVYHRDLKPENLLLDTAGNLKVSDFGLSALPRDGVGLLYTTCGTPNYVAPEVLSHQGYDGAAADIWSCGVILYVLMAGYLPFDETDLPTLYKKRTGINEIRKDPWFRRNYVPVYHSEEEQVNLDDVSAVFDDIEDQYVAEKSECAEGRPLLMNAFEMITLSQGLNLSALFDRHQDYIKRQTRFVSRRPAKDIISNVEAVAVSMGLKVHTRGYKTRLEGMSMNKTGQLAAVLEVYEVAPSLFMVDVRKASGETLEYHKVLPIRSTRLQHLFQQMPG